MPNFRGRRFTNAHETLIWAAPSRAARPRFNYEAMKALNDDTQMRSDWHLPICSGGERLKTEHGAKAHPTQKPESLLYRVIMSSSDTGEVILDPFFGSGTTGAVARKLGRRFVGLEGDLGYAEIARARIEAIPSPGDLSLLKTPSKRAQPRIPFGWVVERGLVPPGSHLFDRARRHRAEVCADSSLRATAPDGGEQRGSIHRIGALLQGAASCNGWTFWHYEDGAGRLAPLDRLRAQLRAELYGEGPREKPKEKPEEKPRDQVGD